jgi:hypothetical protein
MRSSAFGRSETFLQLTWVIGAALACLVPSHDGSIGFWIAGGVVGAVSVVISLRSRAMRRAGPVQQWEHPPPAQPPGIDPAR